MKDGNNSITYLFTSDANRTKAVVKFEIKQLEERLTRLLTHDTSSQFAVHDVVSICRLLSKHYSTYLQIISLEKSAGFSSPSVAEAKHWQRCYEEIESFKQQWSVADTLVQEIQYTTLLAEYYGHLGALIHVAPSLVNHLSEAILSFVRIDSPQSWLEAMVHFATYCGNTRAEYLGHLSTLDSPRLLHIASFFAQPPYVNLASAIFLYKLQPQRLFDEALHPEKLISIKTKLSSLYNIIDNVYQVVGQLLVQRGLPLVRDGLLHCEQLPDGIEIVVHDECRTLVQIVVRSWSININSVEESYYYLNKIQEIFRAYKFWFNPNRLIDASMMLKQALVKSDDEPDREQKFHQRLLALYQQLTTTECLDLYGYFANKDSCYLMRTLQAAGQGTALSWLPTLSEADRFAIMTVHELLNQIMNTLRLELEARYIATEPYKHVLTARKINPGRRNRAAVQRILSLYGDEGKVVSNARIDKLFSLLEK